MNPTPPSTPPASRWTWLGVGAMVAIVLGVPTLFAFGPAPRRQFDEKPLRLMAKEKPGCVLIGDSMLETRIDAKTMSRVSGEPCFVLAQPGSSSATWYLMMKNLVAAQKSPPRTVIILFRNRQLTLPAHRTGGDYRKSMEAYMRDAEPLIDKLAGTGEKPAGSLERLVQKVYPLERRRDQAKNKVQAMALDLIASSREYEDIHNGAKVLFGPKNLRVGNTVDEQKEGGLESLDADDHEFGARVGGSFLPELLKIAREKQIKLVFFAVKRRPPRAGALAEESPTAPDYFQALRAYLEKEGARLYDETRDMDVTPEFYGSGDHVAPEMMKRYTEMFWQKVEKLVKAEKTP